jgi:hypothetical protein
VSGGVDRPQVARLRSEPVALVDGFGECASGRDPVVIADGDELHLRQIVLQRVHPHGFDVDQIPADRQQQRAAAQDFRRVPDPHRHLLVDRAIVVDVCVDLLWTRDKDALRDLQADQTSVGVRVLQRNHQRPQIARRFRRKRHEHRVLQVARLADIDALR